MFCTLVIQLCLSFIIISYILMNSKSRKSKSKNKRQMCFSVKFCN